MAPTRDQVTYLTVGFLASEMKMTQEEIADRLKLSQSAVSRLFKKARPYLEEQTKFRFKREMVAPATMSTIIQNTSNQHLQPLLDRFARDMGQPSGPVVKVVHVARDVPDDDMHRFIAFASLAAPLVRDLLVRDSVDSCGITWGFMLWDLSIAMQAMGVPPPWRKKPISFIPVTGDPLQDRKIYAPNLTSSIIAAQMSKIVNEDKYHPHWLGIVPAYIPDQFRGAALRGIEELLRMVPEYAEIFGSEGKRGRAYRLDAILTSVGPASNPLGFGMGRLLSRLGRRSKQLSEEIYGDIGGVLLPRNPGEPSELIRSIERRWQGLKREHLEACARRASNEDPAVGRPGVVVLATRADRAEVVLHAVARGLINQLIIDRDLEKALEALIKREASPQGGALAGRAPANSRTTS